MGLQLSHKEIKGNYYKNNSNLISSGPVPQKEESNGDGGNNE